MIVDYNGMLKSLRVALAQYALGDEEEGGGGGGGIVAPIEEVVAALLQSLEAAETHLRGLGFDTDRLRGATGFARIEALRLQEVPGDHRGRQPREGPGDG